MRAHIIDKKGYVFPYDDQMARLEGFKAVYVPSCIEFETVIDEEDSSYYYVLPDLPLQKWREMAKREIVEAGDKITRKITDKYLEDEVKGWPVKYTAAKNYLNNEATEDEIALLTSEMGWVGMKDLTKFAEFIIERARQYNLIIGGLSGIRSKYFRSIEVSGDFDTIMGVTKSAIANMVDFAISVGIPISRTEFFEWEAS